MEITGGGALWLRVRYVHRVRQYAARLSERATESWDTCGDGERAAAAVLDIFLLSLKFSGWQTEDMCAMFYM